MKSSGEREGDFVCPPPQLPKYASQRLPDRCNHQTNPSTDGVLSAWTESDNIKEPVMKRLLLAAALLCVPLAAQQPKPFSLRAHLLAELKSTHNVKEWFVPANDAVDGLSAKDAAWTDGSGNHSVGMLANHLVFWDRRALQQLKGEKNAKFSGNNDETFNAFTEAQWAETQKQLDEVLTELETYVETVDEKTLEKNASLLSHIATHNAYHIGQMLYVRKLHGVWNPENGVK
jgi:uncharacterized damage-inducible protein DinB